MILGFLSAFSFVITTIISMLFIEQIADKLGNGIDVLYIAILIATIFFNLTGIKSIPQVYKAIIFDLKGYLIFSFLISCGWLCTFFGVKYANIFIYNLFTFLTLAGISYLFTYKLNPKNLYLYLVFFSIIELTISFILDISFWKGCLIGILSGCISFTYRKFSSAYSVKNKLSALQILMTRFWPVILIFFFKTNFNEVENLFINHYDKLVIFSALSLIIPTYLNQYAINTIGAEKSAIISALIFPLSWFGEIIVEQIKGKYSIGVSQLFLSIFALIIVTSPFIYKKINRHSAN